jgi:membrane-associated PAP2 superfamily phosphatase
VRIFSTTRHALFATAALVLCTGVLELTGADLQLQALFYDSGTRQWIWSASEPLTRLFLYDGPKLLLIVALAGLALSLVFRRHLPYMTRYARGVRIVLLSLIFVPATVSALKATTDVACPRALTQFGGPVAYVGVFGRYSSVTKPQSAQQCFPAAHASGGFALLSLFFLFKSKRNRRRALYVGLGAGWIMGIYKMIIGDHFLSHTVASMLWAWLVINLIVMIDDLLHAERPLRQRVAGWIAELGNAASMRTGGRD